MLLKMQLNNFRQHEKTVLEFVPGINTIVGSNNSGKSTIPEAIEFAYYGAKTLRDSAKGYIRDGASDGSAVVLCNIGKDKYSIGRNSRDAEVRKNGELDAKYKDNVSAYVATVTGVNSVGFRLGHYVRQKELAEFSNLRPGKRHERVEKMLRVHAVDKAIERLKGEISSADMELGLLMKQYQDPEAVDNELIDLELAAEGLRFRGVGIGQELDKVKEFLATERASAEASAIAKERARGLEDRLTELRRDLEEAKEASQKLDGIRLSLGSVSRVSDDAYRALNERVVELQHDRLKHAEMTSLRAEIEAIGDLAVPDQPLCPEEPDKLRFNSAAAAFQNVKVTVLAFKKITAGVKCPTCHQEVPESHVQETLANMEDLLENAQYQFDQERETYDEKLASYLEAKAKYDRTLRARRDAELRRERRDELLARYVETAFDESALTSLTAELDAARRAREEWLRLDGVRQRLESRAERLDQLNTDLAATEIDLSLTEVEGAFDDSELQRLEDIETELTAAHRKQASDLAHVEGRILELKRSYDRAVEIKSAIGELSEKVASLKAQRDGFVLFKRHLTAKIRPLLQDVAESLFHKVTKDRYASYQLGSDYDISLTTHGGYIRKLATISGSENDLACLCLRLAIATLRSSKLAGSLGFVILDEISGSFDDERTKQTLEGLLELRDVIPQIINITHKPVEMKYADRLFTVKENGGRAVVSWEDR